MALKADGDTKAVVAKMKELPTDDPLFGKDITRADGRKIHDIYLFESEEAGRFQVSGRLIQVPRCDAQSPSGSGQNPTTPSASACPLPPAPDKLRPGYL